LVGEQIGMLVVEQHIGDCAPNILNPIIKQILDNLTLETGHQIIFKKINFHFYYGFLWKFISSTYNIRLEWLLHDWISLMKIYKLASV
jgi:hypothetical protein